MNLLFDTNILINISRDKSEHKILDFVNPKLKDVYVSYVSIAEIESIVFQNNWSSRKIKRLESFLEEVRIIEIDSTLLKTYGSMYLLMHILF